MTMSDLSFSHSYSFDNKKRNALIELFEPCFGIPAAALQEYYEAGHWDPTYRPFSLFEGERVVANVSLFDFPVVINGRAVKAAGIQSVMVHPDKRGEGLARKMMEEVLARFEGEYELFFLYGASPQMYEKFGFDRVPMSHFVVEDVSKTGAREDVQELNAENEADVQLLRRLFQVRRPVSDVFGVAHHQSPFFLNVSDRQTIAYLYARDVAVVYQLTDGVFHLLDIIGAQIPTLSEILGALDLDVQSAEVHFSPDLLQTKYTALEPNVNAKFMVRGNVSLPEAFELSPTVAF
jgi:GNAT superfamily N-acetyltransferase